MGKLNCSHNGRIVKTRFFITLSKEKNKMKHSTCTDFLRLGWCHHDDLLGGIGVLGLVLVLGVVVGDEQQWKTTKDHARAHEQETNVVASGHVPHVTYEKSKSTYISLEMSQRKTFLCNVSKY